MKELRAAGLELLRIHETGLYDPKSTVKDLAAKYGIDGGAIMFESLELIDERSEMEDSYALN